MSTLTMLPSEIEAAPSDDRLYEIIDGKRVEKRMGIREVHLNNLIALYLGRFALDHQLGLVEAEMLFNFGDQRKNQRRPDIAFISHQRWPKGRKLPDGNAFPVVPDLVVEVVSPTNLANEVEDKIVEYLEAGVRVLWNVCPTTARIYIYDRSATIKVVSREGELDGGEVLPGFQLPLADLFEADDV